MSLATSRLFKSRQAKSEKNLKKLLISAPLGSHLDSAPATPVSLPPTPKSATPVVVLRVKYDFQPSSLGELTVKQGDYLRLVNRPGNGWLVVRFLDDSPQTGLVPASYVDIAVNDQINPVSLKWLNEIRNSPPSEIFIQETFQDTPHGIPQLSNSYPRHVKVVNVLQNQQNRIWYRVDFVMNDGSKIYVAKHYQDFYNLHINLSMMGQSYNLPRLPQPIRMDGRIKDKRCLESLVTRCNELNVYLNKLIKLPQFQRAADLYTFIDKAEKKAVVNKFDDLTETVINHMLHENSINLMDLIAPTPTNTSSFSCTAPLPPVAKTQFLAQSKSLTDLLKAHNLKYSTYMRQAEKELKLPESNSQKSFSSLFNTYEDDEFQAPSPTSLDEQFEKKHLVNSSRSNSEVDSVFSHPPTTPTANHNFDELPLTPTTPILEEKELVEADDFDFSSHSDKTRNMSVASTDPDHVKLKIMLNNAENDIVVLKMKQTNLISVEYLKKLLSYKIYKDYHLINHYILEVVGEGALADEELLAYIKARTKVSLKIVRKR